MNVHDIQADFLSRRPKEDNKHLELLISAIKESSMDTAKLMEMMSEIMRVVSERKEPVIPKPEVNVNFDVEALAKAIKPQQIEAPNIHIDAPSIDMKAAVAEIEARREAISYEFNIKRGSDGKIVSVIASPI